MLQLEEAEGQGWRGGTRKGTHNMNYMAGCLVFMLSAFVWCGVTLTSPALLTWRFRALQTANKIIDHCLCRDQSGLCGQSRCLPKAGGNKTRNRTRRTVPQSFCVVSLVAARASNALPASCVWDRFHFCTERHGQHSVSNSAGICGVGSEKVGCGSCLSAEVLPIRS